MSINEEDYLVNSDSLSKFPRTPEPCGKLPPTGGCPSRVTAGEQPARRNHKPEKQERAGLSLKLMLCWPECRFPELRGAGLEGSSWVTDGAVGRHFRRVAAQSQGRASGRGRTGALPGPTVGESTPSASSASPAKVCFFPQFLA